MNQPESAIDVKMYEFGRLIDALLDASHDCEIAEGRHHATARSEYKKARERLMDTIRSAVSAALPSSTLCLAKAFGGEWCIGKCSDSRDCSASPLPSQERQSP